MRLGPHAFFCDNSSLAMEAILPELFFILLKLRFLCQIGRCKDIGSLSIEYLSNLEGPNDLTFIF
uniref:Uncharacterized protein n=1 Tax=Anguilla anguilla TaxID=7936 RepID=A0A0E9WB95_ANGAN